MLLSEDARPKYQGAAGCWTLSRSLDILFTTTSNTQLDNVAVCWRLTSTMNEQEHVHAVSATFCVHVHKSEWPTASEAAPKSLQGFLRRLHAFYNSIKHSETRLAISNDPSVTCEGAKAGPR